DLLLSLVFGGIITIATYTGTMIGDYNMNTKVIGALAAGLLGGPLVGIYSSLLGCIYVYFFSPHPAFALPSAYALLLIGMLG
ncbi:LytS/YhcK type 5TM receptor domain-containing protein, partial [Acinetobacter baumannii]|nr:LytS/YhcK type 5TM receptor domain-containing protein [Acinetobacter baumannii]